MAQSSGGVLTISPSSVAFPLTLVGDYSMKSVTLGNSGGASLTIAAATISGPGFRLYSLTLPATIAPGQSLSIRVMFSPSSAGSVSGNVTFLDGSGKSLGVITMSATAVVAQSHTATLQWNASSKAVGYNVYRSTSNGGPYTQIHSNLDGSLSYADTTVMSGKTYFYVVTAVDAYGGESLNSPQVRATIPIP